MNSLETQNKIGDLDIAVIGMFGRFPRARNLDEFWHNLHSGVESISFFSNQELESVGVDSSLLSDPNYVKANAVLEDIELFDASFFDYSPRTAEIMDPQHRLFLETAWEALENAGYNSKTYDGRISVYGSASISSYFLFNLFSNTELIKLIGLDQIRHNNRTDNLATRVAYKLDLKGSAITVQTGCSSSLVAVHLACQSLIDRECDMALAGGVSVTVLQKAGYFYQEGGILSPDGHCRAFDAQAKGTVGGDGVGIVALKRLADALADGDNIHAVIKGSAINNDGSSKVGYTAPSIEGQAKVIAEALAIARVEPETISYVETHGTGTILGDPIEITALTKSFRAKTKKKNFCAIGSVKTNIGHLDTAAGVAGLIKTILALKHKQIPPTLHFQEPNPQIDFANSPFYVNSKLSAWKTNGTPRRAGVSSFGIGGTNAHVIIEETSEIEASSPGRTYKLLVLSAKTSSALETATANLVKHLQQHPEINLADVAYTLSVGRRVFDHRRIVVCQDLNDTVKILETKDPQRVFTHFTEPCEREIVFVFPGQGAQYVEMGRELYQTEAIFREQVDYCCEILTLVLGLDLRTILYPSPEQATVAAQQLTQTHITQPALFVIEYALAQLWMAWGVRPSAMIGHSIGEYVAACLAGVFSLEDALALVAIRGQLMQQMPAGDMLAVPLPEKEVQLMLGEELALAAINAPSLCVVSGPRSAIDELHNSLTEQGVDCRHLHTSGAFHSQMMEPIIEPFIAQIKKINLKAPQIPFVSNVTGTWITVAETTDPSYWAKHLRQTVRFAEGIALFLQKPEQILLEVGPGRTLTTLARRHPDKTAQQVMLTSLRHPQESDSDVAFLLNTLGQLWLTGVEVDWSRFYTHERRHRLPLPTYCFERQRYWIESKKQANAVKTDVETLPTTSLRKNPEMANWFYIPSWKRSPLSINQPSENPVLSCTLVFIDECGLGEELVKRLELEDRDVIAVRIGSEFTKLSECPTDRLCQRLYTLNPRQRDDYETLLHELLAQNKFPKTIVHLWSVTPVDRVELELETVDKSQETGFYSLLFLAQALGKQNFTDELQIAVISNNMQEVAGEELFYPEKATLLGPIRVIPQEYPNISCRSIDVVIPQEANWSKQKLIDQLLVELQVHTSDRVIAYRGFHRWVQNFEPVRLAEAKEETPRLRERGVYLITGGLGGIGLVLAEHLALTVRAKLILTGRSAFPAPDEWEQWLTTHDEQDVISCNIRKVLELEELGAEVLAISADVTNSEQMQQAIAQAQEQFGQLNGVIHAAGVPGGGVIQRKTPEMAESILAPKVKGTLVLDSILKDVQLDFFVLCSARTGILGGFGQVDYVGANAFLDAFAHHKTNQDATFTVSIDWCAWQEVGMAAQAAQQRDQTSDISQTRQFKEVTHPLFDQCIVEGSQQEIYISHLSVNKHWVLKEHRVRGKATLPETAYLEIARAACENHAQDKTIEIREVYLLTPLIVGDDEEKEVCTLLKKQGDGFEFLIISQSNLGSEQWLEHARGEIVCLEPESPEKHDIKEIEAKCHEREIIFTQDHQPQSEYIEFGPRWNNFKQGKLGINEGLASIELPKVFAADINSYQLHPALLDTAVSSLAGRFKDGAAYLPFYYKRLRIKRPLPTKVYSYMKYLENKQSQKEILKFNITIMDDQGTELVEIEDFTLKKVDIDILSTKVSCSQSETTPPVPESQNLCLKISSPGILSSLTFEPTTRQKPGYGEVEISVGATGLNFKEVLMALGLLPVPPNVPVKFGLECAGKIVALGEGVEGFEIGDEVIAFGYSCFSPFITTSAKWVVPKPDHLSLEEAATIPIAFATAYNSLIKVGKLCQGESVLIHAAAGGVGMAAVQIAQWIGAKIFATAGNAEKRAFLHSLGIEHIMDSRSLAFADEVMKRTDGRGVDVVLNSLGGEFIPKSLAILAPYGRFLEIGVRDILNNSQLGLRPFEKSLSFFATPLNREHPNFSNLWNEVIQHFHDGNFSPLPHHVFPITSVASAFEYMAATKHIGKIVVSLQDKEALSNLVTEENQMSQEATLTVASSVQSRTPSPILSSASSGLFKKPGASTNRFQRQLLKEELLPTEGIEVFRRILGSTLSQVIVSTYELQSRDFLIQGKQDNGFQAKSYPKVLETANLSKLTQQRPSLINPYVAPRNETEQTFADIWQELLGIEAIGIHDNFFELGGDSLLIVQVRSQLQKRLNIDISISDSFEYPTISALAEYLRNKQVEQPVIQQFQKIERAKRGNTKDILAKVNKISDQQVDSLLKEIEILSKNEFEQ
ncbi:MAG: SDR family NAD(P)-dependent oxidoreductase [Iphinoe sp. HA4291-MV1]|jgi:acyl transferase domain-containing protein/acyl carrier protein|nr:SDR family NAD(P)-dependent oxidoreductase [Iphinoe sp. HA4291-MV1]